MRVLSAVMVFSAALSTTWSDLLDRGFRSVSPLQAAQRDHNRTRAARHTPYFRSDAGPVAIDGVPALIGGKQSSMLLWGRNSSKLVRDASGKLYFATWEKPVAPSKVVVMAIDTARPGEGWKRVWTSETADAHQPPSIVLDNSGRLHVVYAVTSQRFDGGRIQHVQLTRSATREGWQATYVNAYKWGRDNYYIGAAYDRRRDAIYLCAQSWSAGAFRCGAYAAGRWSKPVVLARAKRARFLYPALVSDRAGLTVAVSQHLIGAANGTFAEPVSFAIKVNAEGQLRALSSSTILAGKKRFVSAISQGGRDNPRVLVTSLKSSELLLQDTGSGLPRPVPKPLAGNVYDILQRDREDHIVGGGLHAHWRSDRGWIVARYEYAGMPRTKYAYGVAHLLKPENDTISEPNSIVFVQEVLHKATGERSVFFHKLQTNPTNLTNVLVAAE